MGNPLTYKTEGTILTVEKVFDAPKELVFSAYSSSEAMSQWWAPEGFTIPVSNMDFTVGGKWHYMMLGGPNMGEWAGMEAWGLATYLEIDPPNKIVWEDAFTDAKGEPNPDLPIATITFEFFEDEGKTTMKSVGQYASEEALQTVINMGMIDGMTSALEKLDAYLASAQSS